MATDNKSYESYYVPEQSKYPILASLALFLLVFGLGNLLNDIKAGNSLTVSGWLSFGGFFMLGWVLFSWFATTIRENHQGLPSAQLKRSYVLGMYWFIFSEAMFFLAFFGALFYLRIWAVPWLGGEGDKGISGMLWPEFEAAWPVMNNPNENLFPGPQENMAWGGWRQALTYLPLWNTIILLSSSVTVHISHHALKDNNRRKFIQWLAATVVLGIAFIALQIEEYIHAYQVLGLTMDSGIYGSTFFLLTGFHGFHVTLGAFMLAVMLARAIKGHFKPEDHFGFEAAVWYWHFVDVIWVCLFLFIYIF